MKIFHSRLWRKCVCICLLLGIVPSIVVGIFSYHRAAGVVQKKVNQCNMGQLNQTRLTVEMQLSSAEKVMFQLVGSPLVANAADLELAGDNFEQFNELEKTINSLPFTGFTLKDVSLINLQENWVVDANGVYSLENYVNDNGSVEPYVKTDQFSYWMDALKMKKAGIDVSDRKYITLVRRYVDSQDEYIATLDLPYSSFGSFISNSDRSSFLYVLSDDGCVLFDNQDDKMLGKDMSASSLMKRIKADRKTQGSFMQKVGGVSSNVDYIKSDEYNWNYILVTPMAELRQESQTIGWFTAVVCLAVLFAVTLLSLFISNLAYEPIRRLYQTVTRTQKDGTENKQDELKAIEQNVGALLIDQKNLQSQIYAQSGYLKQYFAIKLLLDDNDRKMIDSRVELYQYPRNPPRMAVLVIQIDSLNGTPYTDGDEDLLLYAVNNIVSELFEKNVVILPVLLSEQQVTVLSIPDDRIYKDTVFAAASQLQKIVREELSFTVSICISRELHDYFDIHKRYIECVETLRYHALSGGNCIIFMEDMDQNLGMKPIYPVEAEKELFDSIKACDQVKCTEMLHQFLDCVFNIKSNRNEYKIFLTRLADGILILQEEAECTCRIPDIPKQLGRLKDRHEIEKWFTDMTGSVMKSIKQSKDDRFRKICAGMLDIIKEKYDTKLTLEDCAAQLNYHPNYLRRIFEEEYGISFSDYLMKYRINVAKKWLVETEMKVSEIALRLNYQNTSNFIRGFKKITGVTPKQYRDSNTRSGYLMK